MKSIRLKLIYDIPAKNNPLPGQNTGSLPKVSKLLLRKQKWSRTSLEVSNKMSKKIHSQDSNFEEIWKEMDEIEPLTPPPADVETHTEHIKKRHCPMHICSVNITDIKHMRRGLIPSFFINI